MKLRSLFLMFLTFALALPALAENIPVTQKPREFEGVGITEKLGKQIDLNLQFRDEAGQLVPLSRYINGSKPVLIGLVYYGCKNLCNFFMNGVTDVLKTFKWTPGKEFEVVMVSIDPEEDSQLAAAKKEAYLKAYGRVETRDGWHFLTGDERNTKALASQVGFSYRWDEKTQQWAHVSAAIITTPTGEVSRYLYGIVFDQKTLKLSLLEAGKNKIGGIVDRILLFCYHFDPSQNKYSLYAMNLMRVAAAFTVLILGLFLFSYWRRNRVFNQGDSAL
jgi:protein SCO1/2